jgi:hypothetical protein
VSYGIEFPHGELNLIATIAGKASRLTGKDAEGFAEEPKGNSSRRPLRNPQRPPWLIYDRRNRN